MILQFPDFLLGDAGHVAVWLQSRLVGRTCFIVGDTSYGSCCVDEVAAAHYDADFLVHFGPACLAPVDKLPGASCLLVSGAVGCYCTAAAVVGQCGMSLARGS